MAFFPNLLDERSAIFLMYGRLSMQVDTRKYEQPEVLDTYEEIEIFGDAPAISTEVPSGSRLPVNGSYQR